MSSERFGPGLANVIDEWHASPLPDDRIANVVAALARYDKLSVERSEYDRSTTTALRGIADRIVAGEATYAEGLAEWVTRTAGSRPGNGGTIGDAVYNESRRQARRATEAAAAAIDWHAVLADAAATEPLRTAIRYAGLVR